jgi:hypothetical protein
MLGLDTMGYLFLMVILQWPMGMREFRTDKYYQSLEKKRNP